MLASVLLWIEYEADTRKRLPEEEVARMASSGSSLEG